MVLRALQGAQKVTAPSEFTARAIERYGRIAVAVLHNAVDFARFQTPADVRGMRNRIGEGRIVLSVGAIKPRKGFDVVLRAFARIASRFPDARYAVAGKDAWNGTLQRMAAELRILDRVRFLGPLPEDELVAAFQACDIYAHTPRVVNGHFEGFGIVYLEAAACGKPSIASRSGGVPDAVLAGKTGLLVPEEDVDATAAALELLLEDEQLRRSMGERAREWAKAHDWDWYVGAFLAILEAAMSDERGNKIIR
jgi:phosphatidylinositol alpha-1,6-mannosyltransferase